jgi:hypothetical protein
VAAGKKIIFQLREFIFPVLRALWAFYFCQKKKKRIKLGLIIVIGIVCGGLTVCYLITLRNADD